ncbi:hypothetical protein AC249_AIPGENE979 [Exaiptasia diaphana]|nr:hypothetical protein AC249_AIPGENE979 [Exaiptasia diaphana]
MILTAMIYHVPQFLRKYGSINKFSCQPVEKKNHLQNQVFHRASQKGGCGSKYTVQILQRENRSLFAKKNPTYTERKESTQDTTK